VSAGPPRDANGATTPSGEAIVRVIECDYCGDLVSAANDEELAGRLRGHLRQEHPEQELEDGRARKLVSERAYDASDS
jgi:hypothetical protein